MNIADPPGTRLLAMYPFLSFDGRAGCGISSALSGNISKVLSEVRQYMPMFPNLRVTCHRANREQFRACYINFCPSVEFGWITCVDVSDSVDACRVELYCRRWARMTHAKWLPPPGWMVVTDAGGDYFDRIVAARRSQGKEVTSARGWYELCEALRCAAMLARSRCSFSLIDDWKTYYAPPGFSEQRLRQTVKPQTLARVVLK